MLNLYRDVFKSFHENDVKYVEIGGIASILHGVPRTTFDLDILIEPTLNNVEKLLGALAKIGMETATLVSAEKVLENEITIFKDRIRIDVQTKTPGIEFQDAWNRRETMTYRSQPFFVVTKEDHISSKTAAGRPVDLEDVRLLETSKDRLNDR